MSVCNIKWMNHSKGIPCFSWKIKSQEVEETLKRIQQHKGVVGTIVVNNEGECARHNIGSHASIYVHLKWPDPQLFCWSYRPNGKLFTFSVASFFQCCHGDVMMLHNVSLEILLLKLLILGVAVKSTLDNTSTVQYAGLMGQLADKARSVVRDLDPSNDLTFLRIRSKKHEIMIAPDKDFIMIVIQNPTD